ncbi:protein containing GGDEF domain [Sulfurimonas gotlandica GD1]|uniref:diguanylate cyclase n=1 Tax=Sulfurimonas gotlandica (strain DSM 19862 / JCM 16533 / GD1) TaxID=929558 RepID=B6BHI0_SULGG|nr:GGDEF domain-containing protein [Sulfurimonas gotlandica]EDZ63517.1 diguanylate cyclase [Sulfurimonas gotlandica GD1]EHP29977.1 protein containing GGDEF domain [Sulfurimonas gotlandica GD1]
MSINYRYIFCSYNLFAFKDSQTQERFNEWRRPSRLKHISAISILTASLYLIFAYITRSFIPADILPLATLVHVYLVPSILILIALLAYFKIRYFLMTFLLIIAPIVAAIGNMLIVSEFEGYTTYQTELYLIIFWVFTVSGLKFIHALLSGLLIYISATLSAYLIYPMNTEAFVLHSFWMIAALSFGILSGYLLESSQKTIFLKKEELEKIAITDKLTGLYNRTMSDKVVKDELEKSKRYGHSFGLMMLDIDYFKNVNDTYGHLVGDDVLVEFTNILKKYTRSTDTLIRWGGEEFIIISLEVDKDGLMTLAEHIRKKVEGHNFKTVGTKTVSIGVTLNKDNDDINSIVQRADQALYKSKNSGRNRSNFLD